MKCTHLLYYERNRHLQSKTCIFTIHEKSKILIYNVMNEKTFALQWKMYNYNVIHIYNKKKNIQLQSLRQNIDI
jgi:hypothetical protein